MKTVIDKRTIYNGLIKILPYILSSMEIMVRDIALLYYKICGLSHTFRGNISNRLYIVKCLFDRYL